MKKSKIIFFAFGVLASLYLLLPEPKLPPPDLPESLKSDLPGDTVQLVNVSAYFTEKEREDLISFYQDYFSRSPFLNLPLITIRLNHPPEYAKEIIRDTVQSYYFEELIHPFKSSLFINGFDWQNDVFTPPDKRAQNKLIFKQKTWPVKVTLKWFHSGLAVRLFIFWSVWMVFAAVSKLWFSEIKSLFIFLTKKKR
ncbi:MAG: hypothetical protein ABH867_04050 [Patescibacteria group bacterium]|nr:hypothetical protein [Patescibacteria group bacterium]